ncbi:hypothetical protein HYDPIDRAFT_104715 [Hydnomerulius pinastri MD-312]|nr:hypothetical protein HYDPIDRAFT_104715 [Hydnomerulius pinastri MD-312]
MFKRVVVVTGASKGIGIAVVRSLLEEHGANVVAISRSRTPELNELAGKHGTSLFISECDVTDEEGQKSAFSEAIGRFGRIDGLVLNAGTLDPLGRITNSEIGLDAWERHFDVNFFSLVSALKVAIPALRDTEGRVIFISSGAATGSTPGWAAYNAGKAAMNSLARTLAKEESNVVSLAFAPGKVNTGMQEALRAKGAGYMDEVDHKIFRDAFEQGTLVDPNDVGYVIANLSLNAHNTLSGLFVRFNDENCKDFGRK